jgi:hypothetical protein
MGEGIKAHIMPDDQGRADLSQSDRTEMAESDGFGRKATSSAADLNDFGSDRGPSDPPPMASGSRGSRNGSPGVLSGDGAAGAGWVIETVVSPFQWLYQDALHFHTQSRLARSESEASRLSRAALLLYVSSAEALVHQAVEELGRPELQGLLANSSRPLPLFEVWRLLPAIVAQTGVPTRSFDPELPPWPQFAELLMLRTSWAYPGPASGRRAFYRSARRDGDYEPLKVHQVPASLGRAAAPADLAYPRTGLPRDPYALRPLHLDTVRRILDASIEALDGCMGGALTKGQRHRREPVRVVHPPSDANLK